MRYLSHITWRGSQRCAISKLVLLALHLNAAEPGLGESDAIPPIPRLTTSVGLDFVAIPGGSFQRGSTAAGWWTVHLSPFYTSRTSVTTGQYRQFVLDTGRPVHPRTLDRYSPDGVYGNPRLEWLTRSDFGTLYIAKSNNLIISWEDARAFSDWLSAREDRPFALITEAQYDYVCRSGEITGDQSFWWFSRQPSAMSNWGHDGDHAGTGVERYLEREDMYAMTPWGVYWIYSSPWMRDPFNEEWPLEGAIDPEGPADDGKRDRMYCWSRSLRRPAERNIPRAGLVLVSPIQPSDQRPWTPPALPVVPPTPVIELPETTLDLGNEIGLTLMQIPAGHFVMGREAQEFEWLRDTPPTGVTMTPYWLGRSEVTQAQFQAVTGLNPSLVKGGSLPVHSVVLSEVMAFCDLITERERQAGRLGDDEEYRLPTEAEWERAARAGTQTLWSWGDDPALALAYANIDHIGAAGPEAVAQRLPNAWGFYDMEGNVFEWICEANVPYPGGEMLTHWHGKLGGREGSFKDWLAVRGGAFNYSAESCQPRMRRAMHIMSRVYHLGFRLARGPVQPAFDQGDRSTHGFARIDKVVPKVYDPIMERQRAAWVNVAPGTPGQ